MDGMRLPKRDLLATALVGAAAVLHLLWVLDATLPGMSGTRATGVAVLLLGFAASASAVVPHVDELIHGNRAYLAVTSLLGVVALVAGLQLLFTASELALGVLMATMGLLWLIATVHHALLAGATSPTHPSGPPRGARTA